MNSVVLQGNVTRDGEVKVFTNGQVTRFGLAINRNVKKNDEWTEEVNFFDVEYWGKQVVERGDAVLIGGRLKQDSWEVDGQKRTKVIVVADSIKRFEGYKRAAAVNTSNQETVGAGVGGEEIPF